MGSRWSQEWFITIVLVRPFILWNKGLEQFSHPVQGLQPASGRAQDKEQGVSWEWQLTTWATQPRLGRISSVLVEGCIRWWLQTNCWYLQLSLNWDSRWAVIKAKKDQTVAQVSNGSANGLMEIYLKIRIQLDPAWNMNFLVPNYHLCSPSLLWCKWFGLSEEQS